MAEVVALPPPVASTLVPAHPHFNSSLAFQSLKHSFLIWQVKLRLQIRSTFCPSTQFDWIIRDTAPSTRISLDLLDCVSGR
jgi:hypothetical protein